MKQIMATKMQNVIFNLKRFLATGLLVVSMPIIMGNGGCESFDVNELNAVTYQSLANSERSKGNYEKANGYETISQISAVRSRRNYQSSEAEKDRQAQLEAARILAGGNNNQESQNYSAFACNGFTYDRNHQVNGCIGKGKTEFHQNENILVVLETRHSKGTVLVRKVFGNDDTEPFLTKSQVIDREDAYNVAEFQTPDVAKYRIEWYIQGEINPIRKVEIQVIP